MLCWHCVVEGLDQEGQMWRDIKREAESGCEGQMQGERERREEHEKEIASYHITPSLTMHRTPHYTRCSITPDVISHSATSYHITSCITHFAALRFSHVVSGISHPIASHRITCHASHIRSPNAAQCSTHTHIFIETRTTCQSSLFLTRRRVVAFG